MNTYDGDSELEWIDCDRRALRLRPNMDCSWFEAPSTMRWLISTMVDVSFVVGIAIDSVLSLVVVDRGV